MRREGINRHLEWDKYRSELYSWHSLKAGTEPAALVKLALRDLRALKTALDRARKIYVRTLFS
jgi:hypothetical protein